LFHRVLRVLRGGELLAVFLALIAASCAAPLMKLPGGPGAPANDAADVFAQATQACRAVSTVTAEIAVSGSVGGRRLRTRLTAGLAPPASARIEAAAPFGAPLFVLVATADDATLLLPHDGRVLQHGRPGAVLEALAGVPLDMANLRLALTGCASAANTAGAQRLGDDWRLLPEGTNDLYLHYDKQPGGWRLVAVVHHPPAGAQWRAEYRDFDAGLPRSVRLAGGKDTFDLRLALSQVETNIALGPEVFRVQIPPDADPITLEELRRARPGVRED